MKKVKKGENKLYMVFIVADIRNRNLLVPKSVMDRVHIIGSAEAGLFNQFRNCYPSFKVVTV